MRRNIVALFAAVAILWFPLALQAASGSSQNNFQLSPAPIPYPYFEPGTLEGKVDIGFLKFSMDDYSLSGLSLYGKGRKAFTDMLAIDAMAGFMYISGQLAGVPPLSPLPAYSSSGSFLGYYVPIPASKSQAKAMNFAFSANAEVQVIHTPFFNAIVFAGPNLNMTSLTLSTPFNMYYAATGTTYTGYTDTLTTTMVLGGLQAGLQVDIPLGSFIRLSPFVVISSTSGSGTIKDDPNVRVSYHYTDSFDIPSSTSVSTGFDIFINDFSIGAMAQSGKSSQTGGNTTYIQLTAGFRFGDAPKKKDAATPEDKETGDKQAAPTEKAASSVKR